MKKNNKLTAMGIVILVVLLSPVILVWMLADRVVYLFSLPKLKKEYHQSDYYKDLNIPYKKNLIHSPGYRVYNSLKQKRMEFRFENHSSNIIDYFEYQNTLYLLKDVDQIRFHEEKRIWKAVYDGDPTPLDEVYDAMVSEVRSQGETLPVRLLVERRLVDVTDLRGMEIPEYITLVRSYDKVFEEEDPELILIIPTDEEELYDMMCRTPDLPGEFRLPQEGPLIWDLYEGAELHIEVNPLDCCISVHRKGISKIRNELTHWHSDIFEIYNEICELGKPGNILAIRSTLFMKATYTGNRKDCPYESGRKSLFRKVYYYEPKV